MEARTVEALCRAQCGRYAAAQGQDIAKALHQGIFGCGHLVEESAEGLAWLRRELEQAGTMPAEDAVENIGDSFVRLHLQGLSALGISPETAYRLFVLSANEPCGTAAEADAAVEVALAVPGLPEDTASALEAWRDAGYPACHHSQRFREAHHPAYRVIAASYVPLLPLLGRIDTLAAGKERVSVALEGGSASGKTTLAARLEAIYGCPVFHMDDFFLQPHQRTPERFAQSGGNVDWERFDEEVLRPLAAGQPIAYRRFDCGEGRLCPAEIRTPGRINIIEGAYSCHPGLEWAYDLKVFLSVEPETQRSRILRRNGEEWGARFFNEWIPMEQRYFRSFSIPESCHLTMETEE